MYQSPWNPKYVILNLIKYECGQCKRQFILSTKYDNNRARCPYCESQAIEGIVMMDDPEQLEELGCMAKSILED